MTDDLTPSFELDIFFTYRDEHRRTVFNNFLHSKNTSDHQIIENNMTKQKYT